MLRYYSKGAEYERRKNASEDTCVPYSGVLRMAKIHEGGEYVAMHHSRWHSHLHPGFCNSIELRGGWERLCRLHEAVFRRTVQGSPKERTVEAKDEIEEEKEEDLITRDN
ncbi:hypothetical protein COOONC_05378 [Cooperia oncophora]